jgi:hypothetical protein
MATSYMRKINGTAMTICRVSGFTDTTAKTVECTFDLVGYYAEIILVKTGKVVTGSIVVPHIGVFNRIGSDYGIEIRNPSSGVTYTIVRPDYTHVQITPSAAAANDSIEIYGMRCEMT